MSSPMPRSARWTAASACRPSRSRRQTERQSSGRPAVIAALGFTANLGPIRDWGVHIVGNRFIPVDTTMATNLPGVFAAGDITDYRGKVRLIAVGFGEAATAANNAAVLINPDEQLPHRPAERAAGCLAVKAGPAAAANRRQRAPDRSEEHT